MINVKYTYTLHKNPKDLRKTSQEINGGCLNKNLNQDVSYQLCLVQWFQLNDASEPCWYLGERCVINLILDWQKKRYILARVPLTNRSSFLKDESHGDLNNDEEV